MHYKLRTHNEWNSKGTHFWICEMHWWGTALDALRTVVRAEGSTIPIPGDLEL